ncbi:MAG: hypothetical protein PHP08_00120 [Candidatus Dojkabacteria bacterium]|nr:hypothetical protein [Candidatus Dojkabacteria bacterium]
MTENIKKKVLIVPSALAYLHNNDEWDSFRNEGRIVINIGFGLSLLGYDVNIACNCWNLDKPKETWNNIQLSKTPIHDHYESVLSFSDFGNSNSVSFDNYVSLILYDSNLSNTKEYEKSKKSKFKYAYILKNFSDRAKKELNRETYYLPPLFPIPSIYTGFVPFSYNPILPELKLFLHYSSWSQNTTISGNRFLSKEQLIIDYFKSKGYNLKISILTENREARKQCTLENNNITFFYSNECNYRKIIDLIQTSDICITNGGPVFAGNSLFDTIALGKPVIYIGDGRLGNEWKSDFITLIYNCPDNLLYIQESYHDSITKLDTIMKNLKYEHEKYANAYKDCNFNNWKLIVKDIFNIDEKYYGNK